MRVYLLFLFCVTLLQAQPTIVGVFGGENCPWSKQLRKDVWQSPPLQGFNRKEESSPQPETPVLILRSSDGKEIGRLGFLMIPAEKYASLFKEMIDLYALNFDKLPVAELLGYYRKSGVLNMTATQSKILKIGLEKDRGTDFLLEKYGALCKDHPRQAKKIKQEIRERAPQSSSVEWQLAVIAFQAKKETLNDPKLIGRPLEKFVSRYKTSENQWKGHLLLSEFYEDKNQLRKAAFHRKQAQLGAPQELKGLIP